MPQDIRQRKIDYGWRIALLGAIPVVFMFALIAVHVVNSRAGALAYANDNARQLVRTLEAGVSATMQSAEIVLDFVASEVRQRSGAEFIALAERWPFIQSVAFIDAAGRMRTSVVRGDDGRLIETREPIDLSGQESFRVHLGAAPEPTRLYIGDLRRGYLTDTPIIIVSKGVWNAFGEFMGVAAVAIRQDAFAELFKAAMPITDGGIVLFRTDGTALYATAGALTRAGRRYDNLPLFRAPLWPGSEGAFPAQSTEVGDGIARSIAYRVAPRYPLLVAAGIPIDSILAEWRVTAAVFVVAALLSASVIAALTWSLARRFQAVRAAQQALRDSETKLKDFLECSSDYQWEMDENGIVTSFGGPGSENFPDMVGRPGRTFFAATAEPNDLAELHDRTQRRLPIRGLTIPAVGRNGEVRWVRNSSNPVFDADGVYRGYRGIGADITEVRRVHNLIEAQRKTEALGRLAGGVAHEINNLLQPILIYAGFGLSSREPAEHPGYFDKIRRAADSASALVRNVLSFARRSPPRREPVDLADLVRETCELLAVRVPPQVDVVVDVPALNHWVNVDRSGLAQVLTNLVTNSLEALSAALGRGGAVRIAAEAVDAAAAGTPGLAPGRYVRLTVVDDGPGIAPEHLRDVFDPFYTTKPQGQGTGLGLSVVAGLVKSWGGAVTVASRPGERTEFALYLPVARRPSIPEMQAAQ